jgi:exo-beta-1,3-glucanase (GH17 family)
MKLILLKKTITVAAVLSLFFGCSERQRLDGDNPQQKTRQEVTAKEILGNPDYIAIAYGGYRHNTRDIQPTMDELKEDMRILYTMGVRIVRTYNVHLPQAANLLEAIRQLKAEDDAFEMYVMLGAWIDCAHAWTDHPNHEEEDSVSNTAEINTAVELAKQYMDIVKAISVGNEAMVHWAGSYYVKPDVILKYVNHLQELKQSGELPADLWITSSDNFAAWGGLEASWLDIPYRSKALEDLIKAVDFIALHTYSFHHSHYTPEYWGVRPDEEGLSDKEKIDAVMERAVKVAMMEYGAVADYVDSLGIDKPIHIGEAGWSSISSGLYGQNGTKAADEYKQSYFYRRMREWTAEKGVSCFLFEAFDEPWKSAANPEGSENHFGLFTVDGKAKYVLWHRVDNGEFEGLTRNGNTITKTYNGDMDELMKDVEVPPVNYALTAQFETVE